MDLQSGYPYSLIKNGLPYEYPKLQHDLRTDVVVMGGGISGALVAYELTRAGIGCVVADTRTIGLGSTCASTSLLQYEIDTSLTELTDRRGEAVAVRAYEMCADAIDLIGQICDKTGCAYFERKHSLYLASFRKDLPMLEAEYAARKKAGLKIEWWDEKKVATHMGITASGAIYSRTAAQTDAYMLTHALHQYNIRQGAQVFDRTGITDIRHHTRGITLQTAHGPVIRARYLVMATGYESLLYIREKIADLQATYAVAGEPGTGESWYENCLIWETKKPYLYLRTTPDHRIIVGGRDEDYYNPTRRDRLLRSKARQLTKDFNTFFPDVPFTPEFSWTGTFASTADGLPYIGPYRRMPRTFFALGFGGNGITFSQIAAEIVTAMIQGKKHPDAAIFAFGRKIKGVKNG